MRSIDMVALKGGSMEALKYFIGIPLSAVILVIALQTQGRASLEARSDACLDQYSVAISWIQKDRERAVLEFRKSEKLCAGNSDYEGRSILQRAVVLHQGLMRTREALADFRSFLAKPYAQTHRSYQFAKDYEVRLGVPLDEIDRIEGQLADPAVGHDERYRLRMRQGELCLKNLENPVMAQEYYQRSLREVPERPEVPTFMLAYCLSELDRYEEAIPRYEEFARRYPAHDLSVSALVEAAKGRYLIAYYIEDKPQRIASYKSARYYCDRYLEQLRILGPGLDPDLIAQGEQTIGNVRKLIEKRLKEEGVGFSSSMGRTGYLSQHILLL